MVNPNFGALGHLKHPAESEALRLKGAEACAHRRLRLAGAMPGGKVKRTGNRSLASELAPADLFQSVEVRLTFAGHTPLGKTKYTR